MPKVPLHLPTHKFSNDIKLLILNNFGEMVGFPKSGHILVLSAMSSTSNLKLMPMHLNNYNMDHIIKMSIAICRKYRESKYL